jgi:hypothetical protein
MGGLLKGVQLITDTLAEAVNQTVKYAAAVQSLSAISGASVEETSRFIQVLDDYGLTAQDAETATRALTKNGLAPTTETLAQLSDEYLKINNVQEKNEFILKNLGRAGFEWVNVLNMGSASIREQSAAVEGSLVLSDEAVRSAREYALAVDSLDDRFMAFKITLGQGLIPVLISLIDWFMALDGVMKAINPSIGFMNLVNSGYTGGYKPKGNALQMAFGGGGNSLAVSTGGFGAGFRAGGGPAGGITWVGERGPELVNLPSGSYVNNSQASASMGFDYYKLASILAVEFAKARD